MDKCITFDKHVNYLRRKIYTKLKTLGRIRQYIGQRLAVKLYKTLVLPDFDYTDQVYDAMSASNSKQLQVMQNACLRICTLKPSGTSTAELHSETNIMPLNKRRKLHTCNMVHNGILQQSSAGINNMFQMIKSVRDRNTRAASDSKLHEPNTKLHMTGGNFKVRGAKQFNTLPPNVRSAKTVNSFKSSCKQYIIR